MDERTRRIVDTALLLAEQNGFGSVRLRDVASQAGVALGTVYRRFRTKEDILVAALEGEMGKLQELVDGFHGRGADPAVRLSEAFAWMTRALLARPALARALLRAVASGVPEDTSRVAQFHGQTTAAVQALLHDLPGSDAHRGRVARLLQDVWFARLVGWSGGLTNVDDVVVAMAEAARLLVRPEVEGL